MKWWSERTKYIYKQDANVVIVSLSGVSYPAFLSRRFNG